MALHHASAGEVVDLSPLGNNLHEAQTAALVKTDSFEAIRLVLKTGHEIPAHAVSGKFTLHCLEGRVAIDLPERSLELAAGQWTYFEGGVPHGLRAIQDASLLLTIMLSSAGAGGT